MEGRHVGLDFYDLLIEALIDFGLRAKRLSSSIGPPKASATSQNRVWFQNRSGKQNILRAR
jgi:hypothetical protein